jgi:hypothetical protein
MKIDIVEKENLKFIAPGLLLRMNLKNEFARDYLD